MKLRDIYDQFDFTLSIEFFPPKTDDVARLMKEIDTLSALEPAFCSVTYGAGGSTQGTTVELVDAIQRDCGLTAMCHLTVVGQPRSAIKEVLSELERRQIENIIALRGDPPRGVTTWEPHPDGFSYSVELVREAVSRGTFSIAVAGFPETHPEAESPEADLRYLKEKVDAGADVIITQLFFDNEDYYRYVERVRALGVTVPIVPGILPVLSTAQTTRFAAMCGSKIPGRLAGLLEKVADDDEAARRLGVDYATEQCQGLLEFGVPGMHFYSLNRSPSVTAIVEGLGLAGHRLPGGRVG